jgi:phosphoenolpyruvate---glycerone phosphotransferase subunit DhaK
VGVLVEDMAGALLDALGPGPDDPLVVLVNGLGSVTSLELYGIFGELGRFLDTRRVRLARHLVGDYATALDMRGFSLTLMVADPTVLDFYDAPVRTPAWRW